jgi:hypothetical protein
MASLAGVVAGAHAAGLRTASAQQDDKCAASAC